MGMKPFYIVNKWAAIKTVRNLRSISNYLDVASARWSMWSFQLRSSEKETLWMFGKDEGITCVSMKMRGTCLELFIKSNVRKWFNFSGKGVAEFAFSSIMLIFQKSNLIYNMNVLSSEWYYILTLILYRVINLFTEVITRCNIMQLETTAQVQNCSGLLTQCRFALNEQCQQLSKYSCYSIVSKQHRNFNIRRYIFQRYTTSTIAGPSQPWDMDLKWVMWKSVSSTKTREPLWGGERWRPDECREWWVIGWVI